MVDMVVSQTTLFSFLRCPHPQPTVPGPSPAVWHLLLLVHHFLIQVQILRPCVMGHCNTPQPRNHRLDTPRLHWIRHKAAVLIR